MSEPVAPGPRADRPGPGPDVEGAGATTGAGGASPPRPRPAPATSAPGPGLAEPIDPGWELMPDRPPEGLVRRFFTTHRHFLGLLFGGLIARVRDRPPEARRGVLFQVARTLAWLARPFVDRTLGALPFPVQLRRRLEILGPTYIKLGQVLALREDLLPQTITRELENLLDRLPVVPIERYLAIVAGDLGRPVDEVFEWIDPRPLGSASIAQTHRGRLLGGEPVILKVVKPGIRETLHRDARLLWGLGRLLQIPFGRLQPKRMIDEFVDYTLREVDLRLEADNAETFAANFTDMPDVVFPKIHRHASGLNVLTMEFLDGVKPNSAASGELTDEQRDRLVDLGAASIIRMIYRDGFFHADLHPGNLLILRDTEAHGTRRQGARAVRVGFIDLGMVGRFPDELRRALLYYYYSLVLGDVDAAARYLALVAEIGPGGDPHGFRREVAEICRRWKRHASFQEFSLGRLIMESVAQGAVYRMYFPVEMVLMIKALVTFEAVGQMMRPGFDVAAVSQPHVQRIFLAQFSPLRLARAGMQSAPELVDAALKAPMLLTEGLRLLEQQTKRPPENPFAGIRGTIFGGFCLLAGAILATSGGPWYAWVPLFLAGILLALRRGR